MAAMVRRQDHDIVDALAVEAVEERAQFAVQPIDLDAAFGSFGAIGVADDVRRGQADGDDVGLGLLAQAHILDRSRREGQRHGVLFRRRAERVIEARGPCEAAGADGAIGAHAHGKILRRALRRELETGVWLREALLENVINACDQRRRGHAGIADIALGTQPPDLIGLRAAHHDGGAVLARDRDAACRRVGGFHALAKRRHAQMDR